ncbi:hypothetical protein KFE25_007647 [Diacronema lutheri]|uniref:Uncharacterized protein n=2 Tax=Diacronema lutheri TaxID=2081491 RepID=A0A8J5Y0M6_DIALT|nr:hypothetical protein KFE25_007647 [Diacronema lutheri]
MPLPPNGTWAACAGAPGLSPPLGVGAPPNQSQAEFDELLPCAKLEAVRRTLALASADAGALTAASRPKAAAKKARLQALIDVYDELRGQLTQAEQWDTARDPAAIERVRALEAADKTAATAARLAARGNPPAAPAGCTAPSELMSAFTTTLKQIEVMVQQHALLQQVWPPVMESDAERAASLARRCKDLVDRTNTTTSETTAEEILFAVIGHIYATHSDEVNAHPLAITDADSQLEICSKLEAWLGARLRRQNSAFLLSRRPR